MEIVPNTQQTTLNIPSLLLVENQMYADQRKDAQTRQLTAHQNQMSALDSNIDALQDAQSQTKKQGLFNFFMDLGKTLTLMASQLVSAILPPGVRTGIATVLSNTVGSIFDMLKQINPYNDDIQKSQLEAQVHQQEASEFSYEASTAHEDVQDIQQSKETVNQNLEQALLDIQRSQEVTIRV